MHQFMQDFALGHCVASSPSGIFHCFLRRDYRTSLYVTRMLLCYWWYTGSWIIQNVRLLTPLTGCLSEFRASLYSLPLISFHFIIL